MKGLRKIEEDKSTPFRSPVLGYFQIVAGNHHRVAKKRARSIIYTRGKDKKKALYSDLVHYTKKTLQYINNAKIAGHVNPSPDWMVWCTEVDRYLPMINQVIDQTTRRVFNDEKVPASEKVFSLFETHTDNIVKGSRDIQYGHKLNFSTGRSGMYWMLSLNRVILRIRISSFP